MKTNKVREKWNFKYRHNKKILNLMINKFNKVKSSKHKKLTNWIKLYWHRKKIYKILKLHMIK